MTTHQQYRNSDNLANIKSFVQFPQGIEIPCSIDVDPTRAWKQNTFSLATTPQTTAGTTGGASLLKSPGLFKEPSPPNAFDTSFSSPKIENRHLLRFHSYGSPNDIKKLENVLPEDVVTWKAKAGCEYAETYFAKYGGNHPKPDIEVLFDNETMEILPIPTEDQVNKRKIYLENLAQQTGIQPIQLYTKPATEKKIWGPPSTSKQDMVPGMIHAKLLK